GCRSAVREIRMQTVFRSISWPLIGLFATGLTLAAGAWARYQKQSVSLRTPIAAPFALGRRTEWSPTEKRSSPSKTAGNAPRAYERIATLGRHLFFDTSLSEPAGTSCATCHDPA